MTRSRIHLSVIVPIFNEEDNVLRVAEAVRRALADRYRWELILVDDGSRDRTVRRAREACRRDPRVRLVALARNYGQSTATQAGFDQARGDVIVTMDGDLQNDPRDIPDLLARLNEGHDLVVGYRVQRKDRFVRKVPSWVANRMIALITGVAIRDNGCALKAYRRELLVRVRLYSDMHRFIPALAVGAAGARITEMPVRHHPRLHGVSKYGLSRVSKVLADLLTVKVLQSFRLHPLMLLGGGSLICLGVAIGFGVMAIAQMSGVGMGSATVFTGVTIVALSLGVFLLFLGLVAESAVRLPPERGGPARPLVREVLS